MQSICDLYLCLTLPVWELPKPCSVFVFFVCVLNRGTSCTGAVRDGKGALTGRALFCPRRAEQSHCNAICLFAQHISLMKQLKSMNNAFVLCQRCTGMSEWLARHTNQLPLPYWKIWTPVSCGGWNTRRSPWLTHSCFLITRGLWGWFSLSSHIPCAAYVSLPVLDKYPSLPWIHPLWREARKLGFSSFWENGIGRDSRLGVPTSWWQLDISWDSSWYPGNRHHWRKWLLWDYTPWGFSLLKPCFPQAPPPNLQEIQIKLNPRVFFQSKGSDVPRVVVPPCIHLMTDHTNYCHLE